MAGGRSPVDDDERYRPPDADRAPPPQRPDGLPAAIGRRVAGPAGTPRRRLGRPRCRRGGAVRRSASAEVVAAELRRPRPRPWPAGRARRARSRPSERRPNEGPSCSARHGSGRDATRPTRRSGPVSRCRSRRSRRVLSGGRGARDRRDRVLQLPAFLGVGSNGPTAQPSSRRPRHPPSRRTRRLRPPRRRRPTSWRRATRCPRSPRSSG